MTLSAGTRLGSYEILSPLGAGGMGEVYRARDSKLRRDVAIKVLSTMLVSDAEYIARFEREARALASLNHPNIAAIYGLEENAIVMELVEGADVRGPLLGATTTEVLAAVLHKEPDWGALPSKTTARIREMLRLCLAKDRKLRLQAIGDARIFLNAPVEDVVATVPAPKRQRLPWAVAGVL